MKGLLKTKATYIYSGFALAMFTIINLIPYSVDDTYFAYYGFNSIKDAIYFAANYGNGREIGNFLGPAIAQSRAFAAAVIAVGSAFLRKQCNLQ